MPRFKSTTRNDNIISIDALSVPPEFNLQKVGLTQSLIFKFFKCPIAFMIAINRYRKKIDNGKMGPGSLFHELLDNLYTTFKKTGILIESKNEIISLIDKFYKKNPNFESLYDFKTIDLMETKSTILLQEYINFYYDQQDFEKFKISYVEKEFKYKHDLALLRGKFDCLRETDIFEFFWLFEHKLMVRIDEEYLYQKSTFDFQTLFYIHCIEKVFNIEVYGSHYNVIRNSSMKPTKKENIYGFAKRFRKKIQSDPCHFFKRFRHVYTDQDKSRFAQDLESILIDIQRTLKHPLIYKRQSSCLGQYKCWYLESCNGNKLIGYKQHNKYFPELTK